MHAIILYGDGDDDDDVVDGDTEPNYIYKNTAVIYIPIRARVCGW